MKKILLPLLLALAAGCISSSKYKQAIARGNALNGEVEKLQAELGSFRKAHQQLLADTQKVEKTLREKMGESRDKLKDTHKRLQTAADELAVLRRKQLKLGKEMSKTAEDARGVRKFNSMLRRDNDRLERVLADKKASLKESLARINKALAVLRKELKAAEKIFPKAPPKKRP
ncbi:MAG: hypothetical protein V3S11_04295 [Elusimicrobiota bacterium]